MPKRIKAARLHLAKTLDRKVSQKELGEMCGGWSQNRLSNYEAGTRTASLADCLTIAKITGVRIEWLQLESGPMLQSMISEEPSYYAMSPPIIEWDEIDDFLADPSSFDLIKKPISPFKVNDKKAFAVILDTATSHKYSRPKTAVIIPLEENEDLSNKEVMCRDKTTGEKALKIYTTVLGAINLIDPEEILPPLVMAVDGDLEIIGRVAIKYE
ncbi:helix-turn-helix domain-containing protein [Oceanicoccus sagamiensis]|nr:helix-turn-helix transcriptional regulator [Oceanicoccus sagamiensis]